jgi:hypothetical protein
MSKLWGRWSRTAARRSGQGNTIISDFITIRPLTKRQFLRDLELRGRRKKRPITLPNVLERLDVASRRIKAEIICIQHNVDVWADESYQSWVEEQQNKSEAP